MNAERQKSLSKKDYQSLLEIIDKLYSSESIPELKKIFKKDILALLGAQCGIFAWLEQDIIDCQVIEGINISSSVVNIFNQFLPYNQLSILASSGNRPVVTYGIDRKIEEVDGEISKLISNKPELKNEDFSYFKRLTGVIVAIDRPEPNLGFGIHRTHPEAKPFTLREVRITEYLRPHLIKSIRFVALKEELLKFKSITEALTNSSTAIALINETGHALFLNQAFKSLFPLEEGFLLPKEFSDFVKEKIAEYYPIEEEFQSTGSQPFFTLEKKTFWLTLIPIEADKVEKKYNWLIKLKAVTEQHSQTSLYMDRAGLTHREMEVCLLLKDGLKEKDIAERLFISTSTVNTHIKNIYCKLGVHSRVELIITLNK